MHGELLKVSCVKCGAIHEWREDLSVNVNCTACGQKGGMRPHIVWFGESVPMLDVAVEEIIKCDAIMIIGTSMQVYPAASLTAYAKADIPIYYIDPNPNINYELSKSKRLKIFRGPATIETKKAIESLKSYRP